MVQNLFFQLLQIALDNRRQLSSTPSAEEWEQLYQMSTCHALTAIAYSGAERLPKEQRPPLSLSWTWNEDTKNIEEENLQHQKRASQLLNHLHRDGYYAMILKGISNLPNYPTRLQKRRCPGDIDVWLWPKDETSDSIRTTINYCQSITPDQFVCYIHIDFPVFSDIPVEAHFRPSFLCNPIYNRRLQKWFELQKNNLKQIASVLTEDIKDDESYYRFNTIYQLLHIFKHLFEEGIGLRQIMDYYLLLRKNEFRTLHDKEFLYLLKHFGLDHFFYSLLWVIRQVFDPTLAIGSNDYQRQGQFLLLEILQGGNFGQYDPRIKHGGSATQHAWEKLKHNLRLFTNYPSEVLWEPVFRLYHYVWRKKTSIISSRN